MLKPIVLAVTIMFATTQVQAADFTLCNDLSEAVGAAALGRDAGMSPGEIFQLGLEAGIDAEMMAAILNVVFVDMANASPTQIQNTFMAYCLAN